MFAASRNRLAVCDWRSGFCVRGAESRRRSSILADWKAVDSVNQQNSASDNTPARHGEQLRPFVGVQFDCCKVYARVYRNPAATAYRGRCPRCGRAVHFAIGQGGTEARFFRVS